MAHRFNTGDPVALREIWDGRVFAARPAIVVEDSLERSVFYVPPVIHCLQARSADGAEVRIPSREWRLQDVEWHHHRILSFAFADTPYAILASWEPGSDTFRGWYVNLQTPLARTDVGFDTREHVLDVLVPADRSSWTWKDEDELDEAVARGTVQLDGSRTLPRRRRARGRADPAPRTPVRRGLGDLAARPVVARTRAPGDGVERPHVAVGRLSR